MDLEIVWRGRRHAPAILKFSFPECSGLSKAMPSPYTQGHGLLLTSDPKLPVLHWPLWAWALILAGMFAVIWWCDEKRQARRWERKSKLNITELDIKDARVQALKRELDAAERELSEARAASSHSPPAKHPVPSSRKDTIRRP
jgi:hypothetical protein